MPNSLTKTSTRLRLSPSLLVAVVLPVALLGTSPARADGPKAPTRIGLGAALEAASRQHPKLESRRLKEASAQYDADSVRGAYLPKLTVEANVLFWDDALESSLGDSSGADPGFRAPGPTELPESGFDNWVASQIGAVGTVLEQFSSLGSLKLRDQITYGATVRLAQPLTPLFAIYEGHQAKRAMVDASRAETRTTQADIAMMVATAYFGAQQAEAYVTIAQSAVEQLETHLRVTREFEKADLVGRGEILTVEVALSNAKGQLIAAKAGQAVARANLAAQMGQRGSVAPELSLPPESVEPSPITLEQAQQAVRNGRSELQQLRAGRRAAEHGANAAWDQMIPTLALVAQYDYAGGQGSLSEPHTFWVGLTLSWDVWDWGQTIYAAKSADATAEALSAEEEHTLTLLELDVTKRWYDAQSAAEQVNLSRVGVVQATEALRIAKERYARQAGTSRDVLEAEADLTRARANRTNAWSAYLLARAQLQRAMGAPITASF